MSSLSFSFPPPPPPPPKRNADNGVRGRGRGANSAPVGGRGAHVESASQRGYSQIYRGQGGRGDQVRGGLPGQQTWTTSTSQRAQGYGTPSLARHSHKPHKRPYESAFGQQSLTTPQASNKANLPSQPTTVSPASATTKTSRLGLIPTNNESDSEDDKDEEADLAKAANGQNLQFEYRGNTSTLRTAADIAAWIAERKKRYPTQAKREAAQKEAEEKSRRREEERNAKREATQAARLQKKDELQKRKNSRPGNSADAPAPNGSVSARMRSQTKQLSRRSLDTERGRESAEEAPNPCRPGVDVAKGTSEPTTLPTGSSPDRHSSPDTASDSSDVSDSDATSSSGSDSDDESGPEIVNAKIKSEALFAESEQRNSKRRICQHFANHGRCKFGSACKYQHERREHVSSRKLKAQSNPPKRKPLWQVMVEKEQEDDHKRALRAIIALGKQGLLNDPTQLVT